MVATGLVVHVILIHMAPDITCVKTKKTPYGLIKTVELRLQYVMVTPLTAKIFRPTYAPRCNILIHGLGYFYDDILDIKRPATQTHSFRYHLYRGTSVDHLLPRGPVGLLVTGSPKRQHERGLNKPPQLSKLYLNRILSLVITMESTPFFLSIIFGLRFVLLTGVCLVCVSQMG